MEATHIALDFGILRGSKNQYPESTKEWLSLCLKVMSLETHPIL